jgi:hypothetical protein
MFEAFCMLAAGLLALLGFALLALSQERHFEAVCLSPQPAGRQAAARTAGFGLIGLALPLCITSEGAGFGSLLWLVLISAAAMALALTLTWRPRWLRALACLRGR